MKKSSNCRSCGNSKVASPKQASILSGTSLSPNSKSSNMQPTSRTKPPRGGLWHYTHPISGAKFSSHQLGAIKYSIWKHEESNGYPQTPEAEIEHQLCINHPASCGENKPKLLARAANFVTDMAHWAKQGFPLAGEEDLQKRLDICQACEYWSGLKGGSLLSAGCRKCGCTGLKLALSTTSCPDGRWAAL